MQETKTQETMEPEQGAKEVGDSPSPDEQVKTDELSPQEPVSEEKKLSSFQKRINQLVRQKHDAEREAQRMAMEAEQWKQRALELEREKSGKTEQKSLSTSEPQPDDFDKYEDYIKALVSWQRQQEKIKEEEEKARQEERQLLGEAMQSFEERAQSIREQNPDFDEVINQPIFTPLLSKYIYLSGEQAPQIAYHLGKNKALAAKLRALHPDLLPIEIGKLGAQLSSSKKVVSSAPTPITPVSGETATEKTPLHELSMEEYAKRRNKEVNF